MDLEPRVDDLLGDMLDTPPMSDHGGSPMKFDDALENIELRRTVAKLQSQIDGLQKDIGSISSRLSQKYVLHPEKMLECFRLACEPLQRNKKLFDFVEDSENVDEAFDAMAQLLRAALANQMMLLSFVQRHQPSSLCPDYASVASLFNHVSQIVLFSLKNIPEE